MPTGWRYWSAVNNSEVGLWYTGDTFFFLLFGGMLAMLMRIQLAVPGNDFLSAETYNQVFTVHGSVMMFLFAITMLADLTAFASLVFGYFLFWTIHDDDRGATAKQV